MEIGVTESEKATAAKDVESERYQRLLEKVGQGHSREKATAVLHARRHRRPLRAPPPQRVPPPSAAALLLRHRRQARAASAQHQHTGLCRCADSRDDSEPETGGSESQGGRGLGEVHHPGAVDGGLGWVGAAGWGVYRCSATRSRRSGTRGSPSRRGDAARRRWTSSCSTGTPPHPPPA